MNRRNSCLFVCFFLSVFAACVTMPPQVSNSDIKSFSEKITVDGKKFAVIAGDSNTLDQIYAFALTDSFQSASGVSVLTPDQVKAKYPDYPVKIKGPFNLAYFNVDIDYSKTDISRIAEMQKMLKTDYILVVWIPSSVKSNTTVKASGVIQLFGFPDTREIAHGSFSATYKDFGLIKKEDLYKEIIQSFKKSSDAVARDLAAKLGILKNAY
jgi:hypothetical protein